MFKTLFHESLSDSLCLILAWSQCCGIYSFFGLQHLISINHHWRFICLYDCLLRIRIMCYLIHPRRNRKCIFLPKQFILLNLLNFWVSVFLRVHLGDYNRLLAYCYVLRIHRKFSWWCILRLIWISESSLWFKSFNWSRLSLIRLNKLFYSSSF